MNIGHSFSRGVSVVDFHGDGEFIKEDVEVVHSARLLTDAADSQAFKALDEFKFVKSDSVFRHGSSSLKLGDNPLLSTLSSLSTRLCIGVLDVLRRMLASIMLGGTHSSIFKSGRLHVSVDSYSGDSNLFGYLKNALPVNVLAMKIIDIKRSFFGLPVSNIDTGINKVSPDHSIRDSKAVSDAFNRSSGVVFADDVVSVEVFDFCGHVYDLQEDSGLMYANSIMVSNCLCNQTSILVDDDGNPEDPEFVKRIQKAGNNYFKD